MSVHPDGLYWPTVCISTNGSTWNKSLKKQKENNSLFQKLGFFYHSLFFHITQWKQKISAKSYLINPKYIPLGMLKKNCIPNWENTLLLLWFEGESETNPGWRAHSLGVILSWESDKRLGSPFPLYHHPCFPIVRESRLHRCKRIHRVRASDGETVGMIREATDQFCSNGCGWIHRVYVSGS